MKQLNNNTLRHIASMLSPKNRKQLASVSINHLRALPPPSVVRYQSMVHPHRRKRKRATSPNRFNGSENLRLMQTCAVTGPPGIGPGQQFQASLDGQLTMVIVPHGSGPNSTLHVQIPVRPSIRHKPYVGKVALVK